MLNILLTGSNGFIGSYFKDHKNSYSLWVWCKSKYKESYKFSR